MFKLFKKKPKKDIFKTGEFNMNDINPFKEHEIITSLIYTNDFVDTVYPACASCYGISKDKNQEYNQKIGYIGRRVKSHHTSILEHSNILIQSFIPLKDTDTLGEDMFNYNKSIKKDLCSIEFSSECIITEILEVRDLSRYLSVYTDIIPDRNGNPVLRMTFGGSIRGYRYIFENIINRDNKLFISIFNVLKLIVPQEFFIDFINDEVMNEYSTIEIDNQLKENISTSVVDYNSTDMIDVINKDDLEKISKLLVLPKENCLDFVSITVDFKNMSRIITQQVTRHRNAITQESQRYVNYTNAKVNSPAIFKDKYDPEKKYSTFIGDVTFDELGNKLSSIYKDLLDQGVEKEDARGYLPMNVQCGNLYLTFTLRTLLVFLDLRLDPHAQAEVNLYAHELANLMASYSLFSDDDTLGKTINVYSKPRYKKESIMLDDLYNSIDEEV